MSQSPGPLLSVRSAFVLMLALIAGITAGVLSYLSTQNVPTAILVAGSAGAGATVLSHSLLAR